MEAVGALALGAVGGLSHLLASASESLRWPVQAPWQVASISTFQRPLVQVPQQQTERKRRLGFGRAWRRPSPQFSCFVCEHPAGQQCQELVTVGCKVWGLGVALPIAKLYDFGIYFDPQQVKVSQLQRQYAGERLEGAHHSPAFYSTLRSTDDVDFTLVVRAARNLPIRLVAAEYRRILRSRLAALGASPDDPGLAKMLEAFSEERLPVSTTHRGCVLRGTELTFRKRRYGVLSAHANGQHITQVQSAPLCAAIMDTYLGWECPVSARARQVAGESLVRMLRGTGAAAGQGVLACSQELQACRLLKVSGRG